MNTSNDPITPITSAKSVVGRSSGSVTFQKSWPRLASIGVALGWGAVLAGGLDAIENAALLRQLACSASPTMAATAFWCASVKFALVAIAFPVALPALAPWGRSTARENS